MRQGDEYLRSSAGGLPRAARGGGNPAPGAAPSMALTVAIAAGLGGDGQRGRVGGLAGGVSWHSGPRRLRSGAGGPLALADARGLTRALGGASAAVRDGTAERRARVEARPLRHRSAADRRNRRRHGGARGSGRRAGGRHGAGRDAAAAAVRCRGSTRASASRRGQPHRAGRRRGSVRARRSVEIAGTRPRMHSTTPADGCFKNTWVC